MRLKSTTVTLSSERAVIDGYGDGVLMLSRIIKAKEGEYAFLITFSPLENFQGAIVLRRFPSILRAVRSYRRYILMSEEVKNGYI